MVTIVPIREEHIEGFHACLDAVCRERQFLGSYEAPPIESTRVFVRSMIESNRPQFVALDGERVVGWCDVTPNRRALFAHTGELGMGILKAYRGQGLGRRLIEATLAKSAEIGLKRVELEVYAHNTNAIALYERMGFVHEGRKKRAAHLDQGYIDVLVMALWIGEE